MDELYHAHARSLYQFAYRRLSSAEDARDVVQDVFLRLWRQRRSLRANTDVAAYLYAMARNRALDELRHRRVEDRTHGSTVAPALREVIPLFTPAPADEQVAADELADAIRRALESLPERQREVLILRWRRQLTNEEIAAELGISVKTVEMHVTRAIKTLRPILARLRP